MNNSEKKTIEALIRRLEGEDRRTAPEIQAILKSRDLRGFMRTWVTGPLRLLVKENRSQYDLRMAQEAAE